MVYLIVCAPAMQIYGTKKCAITRKAECYFRERGIPYHFVDLTKYSPSRGELENIAKGLPKGEYLINPESPAFLKRGLAYMDYNELEEIQAKPELMRTPIVREGTKVIAGDNSEAWKGFP